MHTVLHYCLPNVLVLLGARQLVSSSKTLRCLFVSVQLRRSVRAFTVLALSHSIVTVSHSIVS